MEYSCKTISISKLPVNFKGVQSPLCDRCVTKDCSNPIRRAKISVQGVVEEHKVYLRGNEPYFVVVCQGYINQ